MGLDYYHRATPTERLIIARRTTELATRAEGLDQPAFACEMGAGFPPFFFPIPEERDSAFTVLAALAYGLRGFNIYMAVERDRWIGAPIDRTGAPRPFATFWRKLIGRARRGALSRARATNAGAHRDPRPEAAPQSRTARLQPGDSRALRRPGERLARELLRGRLRAGRRGGGRGRRVRRDASSARSRREACLSRTSSRTPRHQLRGARWIICPTAGGIDPALWDELARAAREGARVTIGTPPSRARRLVAPLARRSSAAAFSW